MLDDLRRLLADESGAAVPEYALVAVFIALAMAGVMMYVQTEAGAQLAATQSGLNNRDGVSYP